VASKKQRASDSSSDSRSNKKSPNEVMAEANFGYIKVNEAKALYVINKSLSISNLTLKPSVRG
jgi:hypothetical protein